MFFHRIEKSRYVSFVPADKRIKVDKRGTRAGHVYEMLGPNTGQSIAIQPFFVTDDDDVEPRSTFQEEGSKFIYMMSGHVIYRHGERRFALHPGDRAMPPHLDLLEIHTVNYTSIFYMLDRGHRASEPKARHLAPLAS
ncbi:MAG: cupin domain-containing protein [Pseudomonadota bacterium]